jgi:hypothetical protein
MLWARQHEASPVADRPGVSHVAYRMAIPNPRPGQPIVALHAHHGRGTIDQPGALHVLAVSAISADTNDGDAPAGGELIFVAPRPIGQDNAAGTFDAPAADLQAALDRAQPGDTVVFRGGYYVLDAPLVKQFIGQPGRWLTLTAMPGETPILDGQAVRYYPDERPIGEADNRLGMYQHDTGLLHINGTPHHTRIQGLHVQRSKRAGISVYGSPEPGGQQGRAWGDTQRVDISFNSLYLIYSMGIISHRTDDITILGNRLVRTHALDMAYDPVRDVPMSKGELPQESIDITRNRGFEIAFNTVIGSSKEAIDAISVQDGRIHHNYIDSALNGIYIDSWSTPILNVEVDHNFIRNAFNGIPLATEGSSDLAHFKIHHNIVLDSKSDGINITEATYKANPAKVYDHRVWNNTIHRPGGHASAIGWSSAGVRIAGFPDNPEFRDVTVRDNIITHPQGRLIDNVYATRAQPHDIRVHHNLVGPDAEDRTPESIRQHSDPWRPQAQMLGDPVFVGMPGYRNLARGDFRPDPDGPAVGAASDGGDLGALPHDAAWVPGLDFAGNVTSFYHGPTVWSPVHLPRDRFNLHRNNLQRPSWFQWGRYGPDFRHLPDGDQAFAGIHFYIEDDAHSIRPTVIALDGVNMEDGPDRIDALPVGRLADRLAFLHTAHFPGRGGAQTGDTTFKYVVRYDDGQTHDIPVVRGEHVDHWKTDTPTTLQDGRLGWTQWSQTKQGNDFYIQVYVMTWDNPRPDVAIESIDLVRVGERDHGTPALFAVSTGQRD